MLLGSKYLALKATAVGVALATGGLYVGGFLGPTSLPPKVTPREAMKEMSDAARFAGGISSRAVGVVEDGGRRLKEDGPTEDAVGESEKSAPRVLELSQKELKEKMKAEGGLNAEKGRQGGGGGGKRNGNNATQPSGEMRANGGRNKSSRQVVHECYNSLTSGMLWIMVCVLKNILEYNLLSKCDDGTFYTLQSLL